MNALMQATLLTIAGVLILALVTALVGPHFIDWNNYRSEFEAQASRMTGLDVRLAGPIDARLLPTPSITLQRIDITRPGEAGSLRARRLSIEFALNSLVRGELKAAEVRIDGAEISVVLDRNGRLEWPAPAVGFDPEQVSIERLDIRDSRALLADAASGSSAVLDRLEFKGELRTLAGPVKGQGSFYMAGLHYPYRIAANRAGEGATRVRVNVDPIDRPVTADVDGLVSLVEGMPRFTGTLTFARPVTRAPSGSRAVIMQPWRLTGKVDGTSRRAVIEQIDFQYGPDERPMRLRGDATVTFGSSPRFTGVLSSSQLDLDRVLVLGETQPRRPIAALKAFAEYVTSAWRPPIPVDLGITIESLTLAGATLQRVSGDFSTTAQGWTVDNLELRLPGMTQVAMSGRFDGAGRNLSFAGRTKLESKDPRALLLWLGNRADPQIAAPGSLSLDGHVKLAADEIAVDRLDAVFDQVKLKGRFAYGWGGRGRPPRIEAVFSAPELDIDRAQGLLRALFDAEAFDWPREGVVQASIGRAMVGGVEAQRADVDLRFSPQGLDIKRLAVGDFGGVALDATGHLDTRAAAPGGSVTLTLDARRLDGLTALLDRVSPDAAAALRRNAGRIAPGKLTLTLEVGTGPGPGQSSGRVKLAGSAGGGVAVDLQARVAARNDDLSLANLPRLVSAGFDLGGTIEAKDGAALVAFLGLDRLVAVEPAAGRLRLTARGPLDGDMAVEARLIAGGLDAAGSGRVRLIGSQGPTAGMALRIAKATLRVPAAGRPPEPLPASLTTTLSLGEGTLGLTEIAGRIANTEVGGRLTLGLGDTARIAGELSLGSANLPALVTAAIGMPRAAAKGGQAAPWSAEPFEDGLFGAAAGAVQLRIARVALSPQLSIQELRGTLEFGPDLIGLRDIDAAVAGGRIAGAASFERNADGLTFGSRVRFAGVKAADLLPGDGALAGEGTLVLELAGNGRSPIAMIGSLRGEGTFTLQDGQIARVDPAAFDAVIRSVDQGLPIDAGRIRTRMETALNGGALPLLLAQGDIVVAAGQARLANTTLKAKGAEPALTAGLDLAAGTLDARLTLAPVAPEHGTAAPAITLAWRGPLAAPARALDVAAFTNWLTLRDIEEKDRRIKALERERHTRVPMPGAARAEAAPDVPSGPAAEPVPALPKVRFPPSATPPAVRQQAPPPAPPPMWFDHLLGP